MVFSIRTVLFKGFWLLLPLLLWLQPCAEATTLLEHTQYELDSLNRVQGTIRQNLKTLSQEENSSKANITHLETTIQSSRSLLTALSQEAGILETQILLAREQGNVLEQEIETLHGETRKLEQSRDSLKAESILLIQKIHSRSSMSPLIWLLASTDSKQAYRRARWFPWFAKGLEKRFLEIDAMDQSLISLTAQTQSARKQADQRKSLLERGKRRSLQNQVETTSTLRNLNQKAKTRRKELEKTLAKRQQAEKQQQEIQSAGTEVRAMLEELQTRWEQLRISREAEQSQRHQAESKLESQSHRGDSNHSPATQGRSQSFDPTSSHHLRQAKGRLPRPVQGRLTRVFGIERDATLGTHLENTGCDYRAKAGAAVHLVHPGYIERLTWIPGFGNTLLVRHDRDSFTVYARLENLKVHEGQTLEGGAILGNLPQNDPTLHFEIWLGNNPENPETWLVAP